MYFARRRRPKSARRLRDEQLMPLIAEVHAGSGGTCGARRITRALRRVEVARCTVERLMAELGIEGVIRGQRRRTTVPESAPRPPDLVDRNFTAARPDQLWAADMTYVRTWSGWAHVACVLDVFSRMIVGRQVAHHMRHRTAAGRTRDGPVETEDQEGLRAHSSQRPRVAIRLHSLHRPARRHRRFRVGRLSRGRLRQTVVITLRSFAIVRVERPVGPRGGR
ncbi:IS3 family transposase [Streptomyces sp. NPDC058297]|uniref:IS3 family transposase n=1 Tax=Streptomyces sp. NPDC058297 TaxID=3346433 RepID=UPI0036EED047